MGCRCAERRAAIVMAGKALKAGDVKAVQDQARFVVSTMGQDAGRALASRVSAAKQRLIRR